MSPSRLQPLYTGRWRHLDRRRADTSCGGGAHSSRPCAGRDCLGGHSSAVPQTCRYVVLFALAEAIGSLQPHWFPTSGTRWSTLVLQRFRSGSFSGSAGTCLAALIWRRPDRSWWLLTPPVLEAASYSLDGVVGRAASGPALPSFTSRSGSRRNRLAAVWRNGHRLCSARFGRQSGLGLLFGAGHTLSGIWFSHPIGDTIFLTINAAAFGFAFAALRWHLRTIWPLVGSARPR